MGQVYVFNGSGWVIPREVWVRSAGGGWVRAERMYVQNRLPHPVDPSPDWTFVRDTSPPLEVPAGVSLADGHSFSTTASWTNTTDRWGIRVVYDLSPEPWRNTLHLLDANHASHYLEWGYDVYSAGNSIRFRVQYVNGAGDGPFSEWSNWVTLRP